MKKMVKYLYFCKKCENDWLSDNNILECSCPNCKSKEIAIDEISDIIPNNKLISFSVILDILPINQQKLFEYLNNNMQSVIHTGGKIIKMEKPNLIVRKVGNFLFNWEETMSLKPLSKKVIYTYVFRTKSLLLKFDKQKISEFNSQLIKSIPLFHKTI